jgi:23S rRNA pseudouridine1911/1915/1917 synthase
MGTELTKLLAFTVEAERDGATLRDVLKRDFAFSRTLMTRVRQDGQVTVNGEETALWHLLTTGDEVAIFVPERPSPGVVPEPIDLVIAYEDDDVLVINKPPGLVVHPTKGHPRGTLANGIAYYWQQRRLRITVRPIHRLDRDTSGLLAFAKNAYADQHLSEQLQSGRMKRRYWALAEGVIEPVEGTIDLRIGVAEDPDLREVSPRGQEAVTRYRTLESWQRHCLLEIELLTGRTHQIRAHLSYLGHPLVGDVRYGAQGPELMPRTALHARELSFFHPVKRRRISLSTELPADFQQALDTLRGGDTPGAAGSWAP